jgi:hypothetical protein
MLEFTLSFLAAVRVFFRCRSDIALEVLALRQQLAVFKRKRPRPILSSSDRLFWTMLRHCWSRWPPDQYRDQHSDRDRNRRNSQICTRAFVTADIVIRGIELVEKIKNRQFKIGRLGGRRAMPKEIWQTALAA